MSYMLSFLKNVYQLFLYGGTDRVSFGKIRNEVYNSNRKCCIAATALCAFSFAGLAFLARAGVSEAYSKNIMIYQMACLSFVLLLLAVTYIGKKIDKIVNVICYLYIFIMLHIGIVMATTSGKDNLTLSYVVFMVAIPLFFTLRPILVCLTIVMTQVYFMGLINQVQSGELLRANVINSVVYCFVSLFIICFMMKIKYERFVAQNERQTLLITDPTTMLLNRRSYEEKLKEIEIEDKNCIVVVFDINGLKRANDTKGHDAGDELICATGDVIRETFDGPNMYNYRVGGDEFVTIIEKNQEENVIALLKDGLAERTKSWKGQLNDELNISYGLASTKDYDVSSLKQTIKKAEQRMYNNKSKFYEESGYERRRG